MNERTLFPEWIGMEEDDFSNKMAEVAAEANKLDCRLITLAEERERLLLLSDSVRKIVDMQEPASLTEEEAKYLLQWGRNFLEADEVLFQYVFLAGRKDAFDFLQSIGKI